MVPSSAIELSSMSKQRPDRIVRAVMAFASWVIGAGLLMMWGTLNLMHNLLVLIRGNPAANVAPDQLPDPSPQWGIAVLFIIITGLVPFLVGLWMASRLLSPPNRRPSS